MNKKEFQIVFKEYYAALCRFAFYFLNSKDLAEDIAQQVFIKLWEHKIKINDIEALKSYLYRAVRNEALNKLKSISVQKEYELEYLEHECETEKQINEETFIEHLKRAIEKLPEKARLVYCLKYQEGLTYREIANYLQLSENTVNNHIQNALRQIREQLKQHLNMFYYEN